MQARIDTGCMTVSANPRLTDKEKVIAVVNLITEESNGHIVVAAASGANDIYECFFTLSWKPHAYTVKEIREIYTLAKKTILNPEKTS